jgi:hypothetical protein
VGGSGVAVGAEVGAGALVANGRGVGDGRGVAVARGVSVAAGVAVAVAGRVATGAEVGVFDAAEGANCCGVVVTARRAVGLGVTNVTVPPPDPHAATRYPRATRVRICTLVMRRLRGNSCSTPYGKRSRNAKLDRMMR